LDQYPKALDRWVETAIIIFIQTKGGNESALSTKGINPEISLPSFMKITPQENPADFYYIKCSI
jgi:hypothetical protein